MNKVLKLVAHELTGHACVLVVSREGYGEFAKEKQWPPHKVASEKNAHTISRPQRL